MVTPLTTLVDANAGPFPTPDEIAAAEALVASTLGTAELR